MIVRDCIAECDDGKRRSYEPGGAKVLALHRISFADDNGGEHRGKRAFPDVDPIADDRLSGLGVAMRFMDRRRAPAGFPDWTRRPGTYTRGEMPYALAFRTDGSVDQCLAFDDVGPHEGRCNRKAMGAAVVGDFTKHPPTPEQWASVVIVATLLKATGKAPFGHTELDGASSDPNKECPGEHFQMDHLRRMVEAHDLAGLTCTHALAVLRAFGFRC